VKTEGQETVLHRRIAAQNLFTNLSAKNSQNLCCPHSQLANAAKKRTSKKHMVDQTNIPREIG